jgi:hypothetical protein
MASKTNRRLRSSVRRFIRSACGEEYSFGASAEEINAFAGL